MAGMPGGGGMLQCPTGGCPATGNYYSPDNQKPYSLSPGVHGWTYTAPNGEEVSDYDVLVELALPDFNLGPAVLQGFSAQYVQQLRQAPDRAGASATVTTLWGAKVTPVGPAPSVCRQYEGSGTGAGEILDGICANVTAFTSWSECVRGGLLADIGNAMSPGSWAFDWEYLLRDHIQFLTGCVGR